MRSSLGRRNATSSNAQGYSGSQKSLGAERSVMTEDHLPPTHTQILQFRHCLSSTVQYATWDVQPRSVQDWPQVIKKTHNSTPHQVLQLPLGVRAWSLKAANTNATLP